MTSRRVLVTGGSGFLGAALARRLVAERHDVHVIVRPSTGLTRLADLVDKLTLHRADLGDAAGLAAIVGRVEPATVFHTAATGAYGRVGDAGLFRDNVLSIFNVLQATAPLADCRVIHTASSLEPGSRTVAIRESDAFAPETPYAASKAAGTLVALQAAACGRRVVVLRPFAIYGPGEPEQRLIPTAIRAAIAGTPLRLTEAGFTRDLVFVDDVVEAYLGASRVDGIEGELINIATGRPTANEQTVRLIEQLTGRAVAIADDTYPARPTDRPFWCADVSKAERLLGWRAAHTVEQGLARTIEAYANTDSRR
jgi:nucleoside-diphosphate-sugar epimerase